MQVTAEFDDEVKKMSPHEQAKMMRKLLHLLDGGLKEITRVTFLFSTAYGSDSHGRVILDARDDTAIWRG